MAKEMKHPNGSADRSALVNSCSRTTSATGPFVDASRPTSRKPSRSYIRTTGSASGSANKLTCSAPDLARQLDRAGDDRGRHPATARLRERGDVVQVADAFQLDERGQRHDRSVVVADAEPSLVLGAERLLLDAPELFGHGRVVAEQSERILDARPELLARLQRLDPDIRGIDGRARPSGPSPRPRTTCGRAWTARPAGRSSPPGGRTGRGTCPSRPRPAPAAARRRPPGASARARARRPARS